MPDRILEVLAHTEPGVVHMDYNGEWGPLPKRVENLQCAVRRGVVAHNQFAGKHGLSQNTLELLVEVRFAVAGAQGD